MNDNEERRRQPSGSFPRIDSPSAALVVEPAESAEKDAFRAEVSNVLRQTEQEVLHASSGGVSAEAWHRARDVVEKFQPVPWFIWRLSNYVFGAAGEVRTVKEGLVLGLRRLLFAAASDKVLGVGDKVNDMRRALRELPSDVVGAVAVIHAISRRLHSKAHERIWKPILDDAILRSQIGFYVGQLDPTFGPGRGMLAGFAGRSGLALLVAGGSLEQARAALDLLAKGHSIHEVGMTVFDVDPLHVSAMALSASGCGRDAAFGTVAYASGSQALAGLEGEQRKWLAAFTINEAVRTSKIESIDEQYWLELGFSAPTEREDLMGLVKSMIRKGHGWNWMV